jgi:hypothetical protein
MVPKETIDLRTIQLRTDFTPTELRRNAAGDYTIILDASLTAHLLDGRSVRFVGEVRG